MDTGWRRLLRAMLLGEISGDIGGQGGPHTKSIESHFAEEKVDFLCEKRPPELPQWHKIWCRVRGAVPAERFSASTRG